MTSMTPTDCNFPVGNQLSKAEQLFRHETTLIKKILYQMSTELFVPDAVIGLSRGGLSPAIAISHALSIPVYPLRFSTRDYARLDTDMIVGTAMELSKSSGKRTLIVDDINDSGVTLARLEESFGVTAMGERRYATLYQRSSSPFMCNYIGEIITDDHWVDFSWEIQAKS